MLRGIFNISFLITALQAAIVNITVGEKDSTGFIPANTNATVGDVIDFTWFNGTHNIVQASNILYCDSAIPGGIRSGPPVNEPGKKWNFTVTEPGYFFYFCDVDCITNGMRGQIYVSEPTETSPVPTSTATTGPEPFVTLPPYPGSYNSGGMYEFLHGLNFV
jgi:plastocyanin